jgi:hypothetical protein
MFGGNVQVNGPDPAYALDENHVANILKGNVSTVPSTYKQDAAQLDTLFNGAIFGNDLDKASRLANTPQQRAMLDIAYRQRIEDQDRRARMEAGRPVDAQRNLLGEYSAAQQAGQDRLLKMAEMAARQRLMGAQANQAQAHANQYDALAAAGGRVQQTTPTMTEVVDPKDPSRMLRVDAKVYKGGSLGDIGVMGVSGKEPSAAKRQEMAETGKDLLKNELDSLRSSYEFLNKKTAIPSTARGSLENIKSTVQSSNAGQMVGRAVGTEEASARDVVKSARLRLLNAIRNATGMSARSIDSNVELQTWLDSLTNPNMGYETNMKILQSIEDTYLHGKGKTKQTGDQSLVAPASGSTEYVEIRTLPDGRRIGKKQDGTKEFIK